MRQASRERGSGAAVAERLRGRRGEIEQAALTRTYAVAEPPATGGPEYVEGLRVAVRAALEYAIAGIEHGERNAPHVPDVLLSQARLAARSGVSLDTVLRRYVAGSALLEDFMMEETERDLDPAALKSLLRSQAAIVDRLLAAVSKAYTEEAERRPRGAERRKAQLVERLLDGEPIDSTELRYDFDGWHVGIVASGSSAEEATADLAGSLDCRLLSIRRGEDTIWAWLGSRRELDLGQLESFATDRWPAGLSLAIGEPGEGSPGWRVTHRQARAALPVTLRGEGVVRYAKVALLASILDDDLLLASLHELYLAPLANERDGGAALRETLRACFAAGHNASSAAAALGVTRQTIKNRLQTIERRLGPSLSPCGAEMEVALRLEDVRSNAGGPHTRLTIDFAKDPVGPLSH